MLRAEDTADARRYVSGAWSEFGGSMLLRGGISVAVAGCVGSIWSGHHSNQALLFFGGLAALLGISAGWLFLESDRVKTVGMMVWQRCAAALLMLTVIEAGYRVPHLWPRQPAETADTPAVHVVTYTEAQGDPHAFSVWWKTYSSEWNRHADKIQTFAPGQSVPYVFKPNTSRPFFHGTVSINSLGLSDREVPQDKGEAYRIVVMGSSHTQCPPIEAGDTPWPAKLEQLIRERIPTTRRIEVLNAGAAGYTMEHNLQRLQDVVLPLRPDMIITYFGYNEFERYGEEFRLPKIPPKPKSRPSVLVGKLDWRFAKWRAESRSSTEPQTDLSLLRPRLEQCRLARIYDEYLRITRAHGIHLVVCNFNMAVDEHSPPEVIQFYEQGFPNVKFMIEANRLNTAMLPWVIRPETGARLISVQDGLNGVWDAEFVDLVHLSEVGKAKLAENVFRGIVDLLPSQASPTLPPRLANRPQTETSQF